MMPTILKYILLLSLVVQNAVVVVSFAPCRSSSLEGVIVSAGRSSLWAKVMRNAVCEVQTDDWQGGASTRRILLAALLLSRPTCSARAATESIQTSQYAGRRSSSSSTKIKPQAAFDGLVKAREELQFAQTKYLKNTDYDGLRDYLSNEAVNLNNFEPNALAILASKRLDDEDKKAIGTIRRYGSGADVLIMYGGLLAEIDEGNDTPDYATVQKYMTRTMESLDEVLSICRNGGFA